MQVNLLIHNSHSGFNIELSAVLSCYSLVDNSVDRQAIKENLEICKGKRKIEEVGEACLHVCSELCLELDVEKSNFKSKI